MNGPSFEVGPLLFMKNTDNIPFAPAKFPFFYGWIIVVAGTVGTIASLPGQTVGVSSFTESLIGETGLSRDKLSFAYLGGTLCSSFLLTHTGRLYDKYGARRLGTWSALALGMVLLMLTFLTHCISALVQIGIPRQVAGFAVLLIGFFALRFTGQGVVTMVSRNMMMKWYEKKRGLVNALSGPFVAFGFAYSPRIMDIMVEENGWRGAWLLMALAIGAVFVWIPILLYRDNPENCGLHPDGDTKEENDRNEVQLKASKQYTLKEAKKTFTFKVFAFTTAYHALFATGLMFHRKSIFTEAGLSPDLAADIFLPAAFISVVTNIAAGRISDFVKLKYLLSIMLVGCMISAGAYAFLNETTVNLLVVGYGISGGFFGLLLSVTWPRFFGRKHLGAISGFTMSMMVAASSLAPFLFSLSLTLSGSYRISGLFCLAFSILLLVASFKADAPQENEK